MTAKEKQNIKREYLRGKKVEEICREHGIYVRLLYIILKEQNIKLRNICLHDGCFCPFYCGNEKTSIRCETDINDIKSFSIFFKDLKASKAFMQKNCKSSNYKNCKFYQAAGTIDGEKEKRN